MRKGKSVIGKDVLSLADGVKLPDGKRPCGRRRGTACRRPRRRRGSLHVELDRRADGGSRELRQGRGRGSQRRVGDVGRRPRRPPSPRGASRDDHRQEGIHYDGRRSGSISDLYFDERSGEVLGFEVSSGLLGDAAKGTSYLANDEITGVGPELMYVRPETADVLEGQVGGLQGVMADAGSKLGQTKDAASRKLDEGRPEDKLIGQRTGSDVEADDGSVIVPKGRRIPRRGCRRRA